MPPAKSERRKHNTDLKGVDSASLGGNNSIGTGTTNVQQQPQIRGARYKVPLPKQPVANKKNE